MMATILAAVWVVAQAAFRVLVAIFLGGCALGAACGFVVAALPKPAVPAEDNEVTAHGIVAAALTPLSIPAASRVMSASYQRFVLQPLAERGCAHAPEEVRVVDPTNTRLN